MKQLFALAILAAMALAGCQSPEQGRVGSANGVTTGNGSRIETGLDMNIGPEPAESSPSVRQLEKGAPPITQPFANDPATQKPIPPNP